MPGPFPAFAGESAAIEKDGMRMEGKRENYSRKRAAILAALQNAPVHPTAEWIYLKLKPEYPELSLGTVYRNLKRLCGTGQAVSLGVIDGYEHFDGNTSPHAHLVCTQCGRVTDVFQEILDQSSLEDLSQLTGCKIESASIRFLGLCPQCALGKELHGERDYNRD